MTRQEPLALPPPAGHARWREQALLDAGTRRQLAVLNSAFLDLAAELAEEGRLRLLAGVPPRAIQALIDAGAQQRLCECLPFALFDLRFADGAFWQDQAAAAPAIEDRQPAAPTDERLVAFARSAIMLAWHLAQVQALAIRLAYGAAPGTITALAALPVATVDGLARRVAPALAGRFGARHRFWAAFEGCAADPRDEALLLLRFLGLQIQGAESARRQSLQRRFRRAIPG